jgi:hypothetical protein
VVKRNLIGTAADGVTPLGNTSHGILMTGGADCNTIGGIPNPYRNVIAFNGGDGIALATDGGINNYVDPNFIHDNGGLGVDINDDGPTMNDPQDADAGANDLQNFPVLTSATTTNGLTVTGHINSTPGPGVYFNLFFLLNDACDTSGYGGQGFIGDITIIGDDSGDNQFTAVFRRQRPARHHRGQRREPESTSGFSLASKWQGGPTPTLGPLRPRRHPLRRGGPRMAWVSCAVAGMAQIAQTGACPDLGAARTGGSSRTCCSGGIDAVDAGNLRFIAGYRTS